MGHHARSPQHSTVQACPGSSAVFPRQGQRAPVHHPDQFDQRNPRERVSSFSLSLSLHIIFPLIVCNRGQANYAVGKAGVVGLTKTIAKEWGPQFGVRSNTVAFGYITTRLTAAKEAGATITTPDGTKVALGIPGRGTQQVDPNVAYADIPLRRPGTPEEAAKAIVAVASPWFSYVNGETIRVTGGRNT